ncbi:hypothetical protein SBF1_7950001 [Candidatus Desulfosporosinus infrequens]|uniref:Uncharacterized protein n=1 Tax=Candidatus Desulfosporosinus infrequens TaxID=2043169 RepID=A0A2U3LSF1_9FIRM|nr:hypothetical protein SBF1_7950001 [Candidatus Desulfosporosinus infrequens]
MEHGDKADDANKVLINKLSTEFSQELSTLGVRVSTLETQVKTLDDKSDKLAITGDFRLRGLVLNDTISGPSSSPVKKTYWQFRERVNFNGKIDDETTYFARFTNRNTVGGTVTAIGNGNQDSSFDNYGIKLTNGSWKYTLGRQDVNLGQGLILNTGSDAAGVDNKFDGLVTSGTIGDFKVSFIGGKTNKITTEGAPNWPLTANQPTEWYGFDASTKLSSNLSAGIAFAHSKQDIGPSGTSLNYTALNTTYNISPNFIINAEYDKSNAATQNKAYVASATYKWDRDSFMVQH